MFMHDVCVPTHATALLWRLSDNFVESVLFFIRTLGIKLRSPGPDGNCLSPRAVSLILT